MKLISKTFFALVAAGVIAATTTTTSFADHHHEDQGDNLVETAAAAGQFETLLAAATEAGLAPTLANDGPFTVFAPTDDAFGALPAGTVETLLQPDNRDQLANILKFHVVSGRVGSDALADGASLDTLAGPSMSFTQSENGFTVEGARILTTDIEAANGIVHVIDRVITPPERMSRSNAASTIERAIARGVPMFNHGNPAGTVRVYSDAAEALMARANLSTGERRRLERGMRASDLTESASESAWQLRYALDDVLASLHGSSQMANN